MDIANLKLYLHKKGYRLTAQRIAVLKAVIRNRHMSASEIHAEVKKEYPGIGIATVYKTLRILEQEGIVNRFDLHNNTGHYEISRDCDTHIHLICLECGMISDFAEVFVQQICDTLQKNSGFVVQKSNMTFYGYCEKCLARTKKKGRQAIEKTGSF